MKPTLFFTHAFARDAQYVATLAANLKQHEPNMPFVAVLLDDPTKLPAEYANAVQWLPISELGLDVLKTMSEQYTWSELKNSLKPFVIEKLLEQHEQLIYLDAFSEVHGALTPLKAFLEEHMAFVVPQLLHAHGYAHENEALNLGIYLNTVLGVRKHPATAEFLDWWQAHTANKGTFEPCKGFNTDRICLEHAPVLFPSIGVLKHDGVGVGPYNLGDRQRKGNLVNGKELLISHQPFVTFKHPIQPSYGQPQLDLTAAEVAKKHWLENTLSRIDAFFDKF